MTGLSFRFTNNSIKGAGSTLLKVEGISKDEHVGKTCTVQLFEIDRNKKSVKIAEFVTAIRKEPGMNPPLFTFSTSVRTDSFPNVLDGPQTIVEPCGSPPPDNWPVKYKPNWIKPHFKFALDTGALSSTMHTIIFPEKSANKNRERYSYEISARVSIGGSIIWDGTKKRAFMSVNCVNLLMDNCVTSAKLLHSRHESMLEQRVDYIVQAGSPIGMDIGIGWGKNWAEKNPDKIPNPDIIKKYNMKQYGCLGYAHGILQSGHINAQSRKEWSIISQHYVTKKHGNSLAKGLQLAGWFCIYFQPMVSAKYTNNPKKDKFNKDSLKMASGSSRIFGSKEKIRVGHVMIDYRNLVDHPDVKRLRNRVHFGFVQLYDHSALIINGKIWECHWNSRYDDPFLFDNNASNPFERWRRTDCGIIMVPPGVW